MDARCRIVLPLILLLACVTTRVSAQNQAATPTVQGWYEYCSPSEASCLADLNQIASGGFNLVINYAILYNSTPAQVQAYAAQANWLGIKIAWDFSDAAWNTSTNPAGVSYFQSFFAGCSCTTLNEAVTYYVNMVKNDPATWGWYVGDETSSQYASIVNKYSSLIRSLDTDTSHPRLFVMLGDPSLATEQGEISAFLPSVDMIGEDYYPIGNPYTSYADTASAAANTQTIATQYGKQTGMPVQAMSWADYPPGFCTPFPSCEPFPSYAQMLDMRNITLQNSQPAILLWFSLFDLQKYDNTGTGNTPAEDWSNASNAAFAGNCSPAITPYIQVNGAAWHEASTATVSAGAVVNLGPQPSSGGSWNWTGLSANGFTAATRQINGIPLTPGSNPFVAVYTNSAGCQSVQTFTITVSSGIEFVQVNSNDSTVTPPASASSVAVAYTAAQSAGDLNIVVVGWNDTTAAVSSVRDTNGNLYTLAAGPTTQSTGPFTQSIYYSSKVAAAAAGANTVTVKFTKAAAYPDVRIAEYYGVSTLNAKASASGSSTSTASGTSATNVPNELIFGANIVSSGTTGTGTGFTSRLITADGDIVEDEVVSADGSYQATAPQSSFGGWVMQMVTFY